MINRIPKGVVGGCAGLHGFSAMRGGVSQFGRFGECAGRANG